MVAKPEDPPKRAVIKITGLVQGVFFRAEAQKRARELNLTGWVKNLPDGNVVIVAEGNEEALKQLKSWSITGSADSVVEKIEDSLEPPTGEFKEFAIR